MANMFCGYACIVHAMHGEFHTAAAFIGVAIVLDMLDGRIARMTGTTSAFGLEFDSLADVVSFGVAPAVLSFAWGLQPLGRIGWAAGFLFVAAAAVRLARFNIQSGGTQDKRYFVGLPTRRPGVARRHRVCVSVGVDRALGGSGGARDGHRAGTADGEHDPVPQLQDDRPAVAREPGRLLLIALGLAALAARPEEGAAAGRRYTIWRQPSSAVAPTRDWCRSIGDAPRRPCAQPRDTAGPAAARSITPSLGPRAAAPSPSCPDRGGSCRRPCRRSARHSASRSAARARCRSLGGVARTARASASRSMPPPVSRRGWRRTGPVAALTVSVPRPGIACNAFSTILVSDDGRQARGLRAPAAATRECRPDVDTPGEPGAVGVDDVAHEIRARAPELGRAVGDEAKSRT